MCTVKQQKMGNAIISTLSALSGIITNLLGFVNLTRFLPFFQDDAHALLYIGVITVIVTLIPTLIAGKEKRFVPKRRAIEGTKKASLISRGFTDVKVSLPEARKASLQVFRCSLSTCLRPSFD
jgi:hypothetical protein